jgi:hypothetical protein
MNPNQTMPRRWARWVGTFIGFPLAGVTARAVAGNLDSGRAAVVGGLAGGAVLGAAQAWIGGIDRGARTQWAAATAIGLAVGLTSGAALVDYRTNATSLVVMGAISGAAVGLAQASSVPMRFIDRVLWAVATPALWAGGWLITSQVIVDAERQHAVFGSSGALAVSALAGIVHVLRHTDDVVAVVSSDRMAA